MLTEAIYGTGIEGFEVRGGGVSLLDVEGYDPLKGTITVKNNKLNEYDYVDMGFLLGFYDETAQTFTIIKFTQDSTDYWWGTYCAVSLPRQGQTKDGRTYTYALNFTQRTTLDAYVFVGEYKILTTYKVDWGSGSRTLGLKEDDINSLPLYDYKIYTDVVTISPYTTSVEVTDFTPEKG